MNYKNYFRTLCLFSGLFISTTTFAQSANNSGDSYFEISKNLEIFTSLFKELNGYYVDPIQPGKMMKNGIDEMLSDLDPYTKYITEEDIQDYRFQTTGKYGGIGSTILKKDNFLVIGEPYANSPIVKAGVKAGEIILEIDGKSTKGKEIDDVSKFLKGAPGTTLKLKLKNPISGEEIVKQITREEIVVSSVPYAGLIGKNNEFAYVRLSQFTERCSQIVRSNLDSLKKVNPEIKGVILDLRFNPGGLLEESISICNLFLNGNQLVVSTKGKNEEWDKTYKTTSAPWDEKIPLAVLINRNSASASEIVSGTVQDLDRGIIIGQKSFGKGLVQTTRNLPFNAKLKVTTAKYYTPSGRCIQALDYTHRNEDGSVGKVADSLKTKFKTKNGRIVYDGGGVDPDISIETKESLKVIETLLSKSLIFDYATLYVSKNPTLNNAVNFEMTEMEYQDFLTWMNNKDVNYKTKTEEMLLQLKEMAEKENYLAAVKNDFENLQKAISANKKLDMQKNKNEIKRILQDEIVTRYYFSKGRIQNQLNDDKELKEALSILENTTKYNNILSSK